MGASVEISIVVPTYKRHDLLARCLDALVSQEFDPERYEIVVADDDANPATEELVDRWRMPGGPAILCIPVIATQGPAGGRNAGWRVARGEVIAFTDDDCQPDPTWLREGWAALQSGADALSGRVVIPLPSLPTDYERDAAGLADGEFVTANCFVRRTALEAVGGFDERFTMAWREDSDLQFSLLKHGFRIERAARAVVLHPVRPAAWGVSLRQQRKGQFNSLLFRKHPQLYRRHIPRFPSSYYPMAALLPAAGVLVLAGQPIWATMAFGGWLIPFVRFCARRLSGTSKAPRHVLEMLVTSALIPPAACYWLVRGNIRYRVIRVT